MRGEETPVEDKNKVEYPLTNYWYGHEAVAGEENSTTEARVKFEYASLVWLPVFCPGQPIVWVSCPRLLHRYREITGINEDIPAPYPETDDNGNPILDDRGNPKIAYPAQLRNHRDRLFFNLGFIENLKTTPSLKNWLPSELRPNIANLLVVEDGDISLIHEMALYRQTRTSLKPDMKVVDNFFGVEALPESSILVFPIGLKKEKNTTQKWQDDLHKTGWKSLNNELYLGGLESIGFGRCKVTLAGSYLGDN